MFKKLLLGLGVAGFLAAWSIAIVNAQATPTTFNQDGFTAWNAGWIWVAWWEAATGGRLIDTIKSFINWMLWLLSLIALVVVLYGGFKMVTAAGDEAKYKEGFKVLKQAGVWLAVIWLAWFVVSIIFWIIGWTTGEAGIG